MIPRRYETVVGIFVVAIMAALLAMVLIVAQQEGLFQDYVPYQAVFKNVSGLKSGSEVHLAGVTVGNVKQVTISEDGNIVVNFEVVKKYSDNIRENSQASIGFQGLLGDKSLELTVGSADKAPVPPSGKITAVEPMQVTELLGRIGPGLDNLDKILTNLVAITDEIKHPDSDFNKTLDELGEIISKINAGKGSLGLFINDPKLYQDSIQAMTAASKFMTAMEQGQGLLGTLMTDPAFKNQVQQTLGHLQTTSVNLSKFSADLKDATTRLPEMARKLDTFLNNLERAGKGLPDLVSTGQSLMSDADKAAQAAQKTWLLRKHVPSPKEHTIRLDGDPGKD